MFTWMQYQEDILFDEVEGMFPHFDEIDSDLLDEFEAFTTEISGRKYQAVATEEVVAQQDHLTGGQKRLLKSVLDKHTILFRNDKRRRSPLGRLENSTDCTFILHQI